MLAQLEMSVPAADGLILKGTLTYPTGRPGERLPFAVLAHEYPATRDSFAPLRMPWPSTSTSAKSW